MGMIEDKSSIKDLGDEDQAHENGFDINPLLKDYNPGS